MAIAADLLMGLKQKESQPKKKKIKSLASPLQLCHVNTNELKYWNMMQLDQYIDPESGLREYSRLSLVIKNPLFQEIIQNVLSLTDDPKALNKADKKAKEMESEMPDLYERIPSDNDPEVMALAALGRNGDNHICLLPEDVIAYFDNVRGYDSINPASNLHEFGGLFGGGGLLGRIGNAISSPFESILQPVAKVAGAIASPFTGGKNKGNELLRIAGTLGGFMYGGPAGMGIGNALAGWGTGKGLMDSAFGGVKNYGLGMGLQSAGHWAGLGRAGGMQLPMGLGAQFARTPHLASAYGFGPGAAKAATAAASSGVPTTAAGSTTAKTGLAGLLDKVGLSGKEAIGLGLTGFGAHKMLQAEKQKQQAEKERYELDKKEARDLYEEKMRERGGRSYLSPVKRRKIDYEKEYGIVARPYKYGNEDE